MTKIYANVSANQSMVPADATNVGQASPARPAELMSKAEPNACFNDDPAPPEQAADSPAARMLRQQMAARVAENARKTGADGTGQGDGPTMRPEPTLEEIEQGRKEAEDACKSIVSAAGTAIGNAIPSVGSTIGGVIGTIAGSILCKPSPDGHPGAAGAAASNPIERDLRWQPL
ncbi:MAG: hypothetical protein MUF34_32250 [Polyangiaceae bacterium]|jgi:hypothetical protein|nr:hypothetical protein [Polyangiaceae bacterium]